MKLHSLRLEGFRRHIDTTVRFSDATFLIGENNVGKSSILAALNYLLNDIKKISEDEFFHITGNGEVGNLKVADNIVLTAEFRGLPADAKNWTGFKGRILTYYEGESTGLRIIYRKTFAPNADYVVELREQVKTKKAQYNECSTINQYKVAGLDLTGIGSKLADIDPERRLTARQQQIIDEVEDLYDYKEDEEEWFRNPGGIPGIVLQKLPKYLLIPAQDKANELSESSGTLISTLTELFNDVREASVNYREAQKYLELLARELDPTDNQSEFGIMMSELNDVMKEVFPNTGLKAETSLSDADKVIKPQFKISMFSNILTPVALQGTGMIRSAVFALLRYRNLRENRRFGNPHMRPLLIGFEEPEIYLHPNAAQQMRDTIYELASTDNNQIVCTSHSPYMIDLSKRPSQILNSLSLEQFSVLKEGNKVLTEKVKCIPFNTSDSFNSLQSDDKEYVKMLLKIDDHIARVFFSKNVLIVEGDTEDIVLRETIARLPNEIRKDIQCNWQIVKARGKATIISLVKYLRIMGINPVVIHDADAGTDRAEIFNLPILEAVGDAQKRIMLTNCIEDVLGYAAPSKEKPYKAYNYISTNWTADWMSINHSWLNVVKQVFHESFKQLEYLPDTVFDEAAPAAE
ncbi:DUF2813 domain-containing protein [Paenibacillus sp. H1-7]|uniref:ATP-dependent nuclease n=1 Tax=Paenibacillus sp. H1-7 TaxID=2282849 RepID=UPI001EF861A5|nr:AAA family ATPase [Paenibacillus sp. H1-7]ULL19336.1 DUF2813 domain-containing protein [Paenibacillus sp. H1-7]